MKVTTCLCSALALGWWIGIVHARPRQDPWQGKALGADAGLYSCQPTADSPELRPMGSQAAKVGQSVRSLITTEMTLGAEGLNRLAVGSQLIVEGRLKSCEAYVSPDGSTVLQAFDLGVERHFKGESSADVTVIVPGGRIRFDDASVLQTTYPSAVEMSVGSRWILFLMPARPVMVSPALAKRLHGQQAWELAAPFPFTAFRVEPDQILRALLRQAGPGRPRGASFADKYNGLKEDVLIRDIAAIVGGTL